MPQQDDGDERATTVRHQVLVREVNERIERLTDRWNLREPAFAVLCECGDPDCVNHIDVPRDAYEEVRSTPSRFVLATGHENGRDRVVGRYDGYVVVEKRGDDAVTAARSDPRNR